MLNVKKIFRNIYFLRHDFYVVITFKICFVSVLVVISLTFDDCLTFLVYPKAKL